MIRLTLLLGAAIYTTLLIAGQDRGQMRPELAQSLAQGADLQEISFNWGELSEGDLPHPVQDSSPLAELPPVKATKSLRAPVPSTTAPSPIETVEQQPVFTLASLPHLSGDLVSLPQPAVLVEEAPSDLRYVSGNSVNVRMGPSKHTSVIATLSKGEAVSLISDADPDWAEIIIQGDGMHGYIAKRLLRSAP